MPLFSRLHTVVPKLCRFNILIIHCLPFQSNSMLTNLLHLQGILPPVLLAVLMMLLPIILRLLAKFEGIPKYTGLELSLMTRYFLFLFVVSLDCCSSFDSLSLTPLYR